MKAKMLLILLTLVVCMGLLAGCGTATAADGAADSSVQGAKLPEGRYVLSGRVVGENDEVIPAEVTLFADVEGYSTKQLGGMTTDNEDGSFALYITQSQAVRNFSISDSAAATLDKVTCNVVIAAPGYEDKTISLGEISLLAIKQGLVDMNKDLGTIKLTKTYPLTGTVTANDEQKTKITDAKIKVYNKKGELVEEAVASEFAVGSSSYRSKVGKGEYYIALVPGTYTVEVSAYGYKTDTQEVTIGTEEKQHDVCLEIEDRTATIQGRVLDQWGEPIAGARVLAGQPTGGTGAAFDMRHENVQDAIISDKDGYYEVNVKAGGNWGLWGYFEVDSVSCNGFATACVDMDKNSTEPVEQDIIIRLPLADLIDTEIKGTVYRKNRYDDKEAVRWGILTSRGSMVMTVPDAGGIYLSTKNETAIPVARKDLTLEDTGRAQLTAGEDGNYKIKLEGCRAGVYELIVVDEYTTEENGIPYRYRGQGSAQVEIDKDGTGKFHRDLSDIDIIMYYTRTEIKKEPDYVPIEMEGEPVQPAPRKTSTPAPVATATPVPAAAQTPSATPSPTVSQTPGVTPSPTVSQTPSVTPSPTAGPTSGPTSSPTPSAAPSPTTSATPGN